MTVQRPQVGRAPQLTWAARNPEEGVVPFLLSGKQLHGSAGRKVWLLDFDDTLFASSAGLLHEVHLRMNAFMTERMGMSEEEANRLRSHYWQAQPSLDFGADTALILRCFCLRCMTSITRLLYRMHHSCGAYLPNCRGVECCTPTDRGFMLSVCFQL